MPCSHLRLSSPAIVAALCALGSSGGHAQTAPAGPATAASQPAQTLPPVEVRGTRERSRQALSDAVDVLPAQTYLIDRDRVEAQSFRDATDLLRSTPGVTFGSSSPGGDIGDDISIRGFNGFHGAQTAVYVDGMPINWSHSRYGAHGLVDINWLTPELIERIEVIKGPFSALYGNFNLAGAINIVTRSSDQTSAAVEGGSYGNYRTVGIYSGPLDTTPGTVTPFIALEGLYRGGYRDRSDYRRANSFNKLTFPVGDGRASVRLNASIRDFNSGGFLLADDVRNGVVDRRSASPDSGGDRGRIEYLTALANYTPNDDRGASATVYVSHERQRLADTSFGPPQAFLASKRTVGGLRVSQSFTFFDRALVTAGVEAQASKVENRNADTDGSGNPTVDTVRAEVKEQSAGLFAQGQLRVVETLKLVGGLRYDRFRTDIENQLFPTSGKASTGTFSPKIGFAWSPIREAEVFANHGRGFRSPSAAERSPDRVNGSFNSNIGVLKVRSSDVGLTVRPVAGLSITAAVFKTDTDGEIRRDPANPLFFVNLGGTSRDGFEVYGDWSIDSNWRVTASHTKVDTRIKNPPNPANTLVITVPDTTQTAAVSWRAPILGGGTRLAVDVFAQRIGERPLAANGSLYAEPQVIVGAKARVTRGRVSGFAQVDWNPDRYSSDFVYDLGSGPVYDPQPRLAFLIGLRYAFD